MSASRTLVRQRLQNAVPKSVCWKCQRRTYIQPTRANNAAPIASTSASSPSPVDIDVELPSRRRNAGHHQIPPLLSRLQQDRGLNLEQQGVSGLYSAAGFKYAWTDYQGDLLRRLNEMTEGTTMQSNEARAIAISTARDPQRAALFNVASMADNNLFYFRGINLDGEKTNPSSTLTSALTASFNSLETLKEEFLTTAHSMFGPGFVWLVRHKTPSDNTTNTYTSSRFSILATYMAGSPYAGAHNRMQNSDMNTMNQVQAFQQSHPAYQGKPKNNIGTFGRYSERKVAFGGVNVYPVLCVNTWQHAYVPDYGTKESGKWAYLGRWWDRINWQEVGARYAQVAGTV